MTSISSPSHTDSGNDGLVPPKVRMAPPGLPWYKMLAAFRTNALSAWSPLAYEQDFVAASFLGRDRLLINNPDGIRPVLPCAVITTQPDHAAPFRLSPRHGF